MDNVRFVLISAIGVILFFLWQAWQSDYSQAPVDTAQQVEAPGEPSDASGIDDDVPAFDSAPSATSQAAGDRDTSGGTDATGNRASAGPDALDSAQQLRVHTDLLDVVIDTRGGDLRRVELIGVPASTEHPDRNKRLLNDSAPNFFIAQNGLIGDGAPPDHNARFTAKAGEYRLGKNQDTLEVPLHWTGADGREVTKVYTFYRGSYRVGLRHEVRNGNGAPWTLSQYQRFWRLPYESGDKPPFAQSFMGVAWYKQKDDSADYRFEKHDREDLSEEPIKVQQQGGWLSLMQHYFVAAVVPPADQQVSYFARPKPVPGVSDQGFSGGYVSQRQTVAPGGRGEFHAELFIGPKVQDQLQATAPGLDLTIDYGFLAVLSKPLFWVLEKLHAVLGNWGLAIILLTVIIKLCFYKLSETQYRSMARMRKFGPRIKQIKEQYGDDREKLQAKMMDLYKKEGFNPLGGCWPMLVQMPVFLALYWVLLEAVELRHAPFMLWIHDLSSPDPYYILPVLFGITMWFQQKLSSQSMAMDPMQQRMMQFMPVGMAVFFAFFPAGLVLYWFTNNLLSIAQQWYIYRKLDNEGLGHKAAAK